MLRRTYGDVKGELRRAAGQTGMTVDDPRLRGIVDTVQERLASGSEYPFQFARLTINQFGGTLALPCEYEALVHATVGLEPLSIFDPWYEFLEFGPGPQDPKATVDVGIDRGESPTASSGRREADRCLRRYCVDLLMSLTTNWNFDVQATLLDGMNRGRVPDLLSEQQAAYLRNVSIRGGRARSRPRFVKRCALPAGLMQGMALFKSAGKILVSLSGRVYELDPRVWTIVERTTNTTRMSAKRPRHFYCETAGSVVIQDFQSAPFIYDGARFRVSDIATEVPVGGPMAYGNGRLAVVVNRGYDVRLGDIKKPAHQSELLFSETNDLTGGGDFGFPTAIKALGIIPVLDTGTGQGALIVGGVDKVFSLRTQITQRDLWSEVGFQTTIFPDRGVVGSNAVAVVNQDLGFRSGDGLRTLRTSVADYDAPGQAPLSAEVRHRFDYDTQSMLEDASVVYFDNRLLCTHSPVLYGPRTLATGIVALNYDSITGRGEKAPPAFDGEWDGVLIAQLVAGSIGGVDRCFILGRGVDGQNGIWELLPEVHSYGGDSPTQVVETRMFFGNSPGQLKAMRRVDLQFSDIRGGLTARVYFRPDHYPFWVPWDSWTFPIADAPISWGRTRPQYRAPLQTREIPDFFDAQTNRPICVGSGFQVRVEWEGGARLDHLQAAQEPLSFGSYADNPEGTTTTAVTTPPAGVIDPAYWYTFPVSPLAGIN